MRLENCPLPVPDGLGNPESSLIRLSREHAHVRDNLFMGNALRIASHQSLPSRSDKAAAEFYERRTSQLV